MEEIKQLIYNYAKAIHTQNEKDFKALWSSKENPLISLTNQFNEIDAIYNDFLIGVIQRIYESIDLIFDKYGLSHISDDIRLCIAECCLYNDVPMHFLLNTLLGNDEFKKYIIDSSYEEIYNYLLLSTTITRDGQIETLIAKTQRRLIQFARELQLQYSGFDEIKK